MIKKYSKEDLGYFTYRLGKNETKLSMNIELMRNVEGSEHPYIIVQNDYDDNFNYNWLKVDLDGNVLNNIVPIFKKDEFNRIVNWVSKNKKLILLYWSNEMDSSEVAKNFL